MLRIRLLHLLTTCVLLAASASTVAAQGASAPSPEKREEISQLLEAMGTRGHMTATFDRFIVLYQEHWADNLIANFRAKGMFSKMSAGDSAKMEQLIHEFSDGLFAEMKRRVAEEVVTTENLANIGAPTIDRYYTSEEIRGLTAFYRTPTGSKYMNLYWSALREAIISYMREKGTFQLMPTPEAELAKAERLKRDAEANPAERIRKLLSAVHVVSKENFTESEIRELAAFANTPLGKKVYEVNVALTTELSMNSSKAFGPKVGALFGQVYNERMKIFERRVRETFGGRRT